MKEKLIPIYALRMLFLKTVNPRFFNDNRSMIIKTSLAAQDYLLSGHYYEYDQRTGHLFKKLPEYIKVHRKYHIPYNQNLSISTHNYVNSGLVMDLAWSLQTDILNGIVDKKGNIKNPEQLYLSEVLHVYHNYASSGTPVCALRLLTSYQLQEILSIATNKSR